MLQFSCTAFASRMPRDSLTSGRSATGGPWRRRLVPLPAFCLFFGLAASARVHALLRQTLKRLRGLADIVCGWQVPEPRGRARLYRHRITETDFDISFPAGYIIAVWIALSSSVILQNAYILRTLQVRPALFTDFHCPAPAAPR